MYRCSLLFILTGLCALSEAPVFAQSELTQRELSGTWDLTADQPMAPHGTYRSCCVGKAPWIPFTPKYRKIRDDFAALPEFTIAKNTDNIDYCITAGVPGELEHPILYEFLLTPGRVTMIFQDGSVRRIWTDGRKFPKDLNPSAQGYSIGHWENERTLVVETRAISPKSELFIVGDINVTTKTRVWERWSLKSEQSLQLNVTVEDPELFTGPYSYERQFMKIPGTFEVACAANNRDTGYGTVDLTPPPDLVAPPK